MRAGSLARGEKNARSTVRFPLHGSANVAFVQPLRNAFVLVLVLVLALALALGACKPSPPRPPAASSGSADCQPVAGACLPIAIAQEYCGRTVSRHLVDACARTCVRARPRAPIIATGECLPRRDVRALAIEIGIPATEDDDVACEKGELVGSVGDRSGPRRLGCLPEIEEERKVEGPVPRRGAALDVARSTSATLGADGAGEGGKALCSVLARQPGALAAPSSDVRAEISLAFPDNDVSQVVVRTRMLAAQPGLSGSEATAELERALGPLIEALRTIGGGASEAAISTRIRCKRASARPVLEPLLKPPADGNLVPRGG